MTSGDPETRQWPLVTHLHVALLGVAVDELVGALSVQPEEQHAVLVAGVAAAHQGVSQTRERLRQRTDTGHADTHTHAVRQAAVEELSAQSYHDLSSELSEDERSGSGTRYVPLKVDCHQLYKIM